MTSFDKKIMFGGYNDKEDYPRSKIVQFLEDDEIGKYNNLHVKRKKKVCKITKNEHDWVLEKSYTSVIFNVIFYTYICSHCGKRKYK